eukprot:360715-Chlamydomonas_euryale.AAC.6
MCYTLFARLREGWGWDSDSALRLNRIAALAAEQGDRRQSAVENTLKCVISDPPNQKAEAQWNRPLMAVYQRARRT